MLQFISRLRIVLALGWLAMVIFLTWLYLGGTAPPGAGGADKMLHTIAFAGATLPGVLASRSRRSILVVAPVMLTCAFGLEWLQGFVPGRQLSLADTAANVLGVALVLPAYLLVRRRGPLLPTEARTEGSA